MEQTPKYYIFDRRTVGTMEATKRVMDKLTGYSIAGSGLSALGTALVGGKIDLVLPLVAALLGAFTLSCREVLSFLISASIVSNPINLSQSQTISQPAPIEPTNAPSV